MIEALISLLITCSKVECGIVREQAYDMVTLCVTPEQVPASYLIEKSYAYWYDRKAGHTLIIRADYCKEL